MTRLLGSLGLCVGVGFAPLGLRGEAGGAPVGEAVVTSWIGNSGGLDPAQAFQGAVTDLWVDRDGTAYLTAPSNVVAASLSVYRQGQCVGRYPVAGGLVLAGNATHLFVGTSNGVRVLPKVPTQVQADTPPVWLSGQSEEGNAERATPDGVAVRGLCATETRVYVSNAAKQCVECWELPERRRVAAWPFARPGALALDPQEGLWVVRERLLADTFNPLTRNWRRPTGGDVLDAAAVVRIRLDDGGVLETLTGPEVPTALAILPQGRDGAPELLVADNGPAQQLRAYSRRDPRISRELLPIGNLHGALARGGAKATDGCFNGVVGLSVSGEGSLHVAQNWNVLCERRGDYPAQCAELLVFSPTLDRRTGRSQSLVAGRTATVDPYPPFDVFVPNARFAMAWERPAGLEWELAGRTSDPLLFPHDPAFLHDLRDPVIRTVHDQTLLFGSLGSTLLFYRRDRARLADVWMHVGAFRADGRSAEGWPVDDAMAQRLEAKARREVEEALTYIVDARKRNELTRSLESRLAHARSVGWMWVDGEGFGTADGIYQVEEVRPFPVAYRSPVWSVDALGDVWLAARVADDPVGTLAGRLLRWSPEGQNANRLPAYRSRGDGAMPEPFADGAVLWHRHDPGSNRMMLGGGTPHLPGPGVRLVATFPRWVGRRGFGVRPELAHQVVLGGPSEGTPPTASAALWTGAAEAVDLVGDRLFALQSDPLCVAVYDLLRGNRIATLVPAPEANRPRVRDVRPGSLRAFAREDGELVLLLSDVAEGHLLMLRWRPQDATPTEAPMVAPWVDGRIGSRRIRLFWSTPDVGNILGYHVYRTSSPDTEAVRVTAAPVAKSFYDDGDVAAGQSVGYAVSIVNAAGEGPRSDMLWLTASQTAVRFLGEDRATLGNWPGRYGALGHMLFGEPWGRGTSNPRLPAWLGGLAETSPPTTFAVALDVRSDPALPYRSAPGRTQERVAGVLEVPRVDPAVFPIEIRDGRSVRTSIYCGSSEYVHGVRVELLDAVTGELLDAREFSNETETSVRGRYLTWDVTGSVLMRFCVPRQGGAPDRCGVNAIFFDEVTALANP